MLPQDVLLAFVIPALLCVVVLSAQVVVFVGAAGIVAHCCPGNSLFGHCCTSWHRSHCLGNTVIPLCRVVVLLLIRCVRQVVDCCFAVFGQVTWLATSVAYCHWVLSFSLVVGSFVLSLSFVCSFHWLPHLFSFSFSFCLVVAVVVAVSFSFSFSFVPFSLLLSFAIVLCFLCLCLLLKFPLEPVLHCSLC